MPMPDLGLHSYRLAQLCDRDPIQPARAQRLRQQLISAADHYLALCAIDLQNVERIPGSNTKPLPLAHGEVVDTLVLTDHFPGGGHQLAGSIRQRLARLFQVRVDELGVVATRDEADLL